MFRLTCYKPGIAKPSFYIQSKGHHAGRPLKNPIANCYAVYTDSEHLYSLVYALFKGRFFDYYIHGTAVPTITTKDVRKLIADHIQHISKTKELQAIADIDRLKELTAEKLRVLEEMQKALCHRALTR